MPFVQIPSPNFNTTRDVINEVLRFSSSTELELMEESSGVLRRMISRMPSRPGHIIRRQKLVFTVRPDGRFVFIIRDFLGRRLKRFYPLTYDATTNRYIALNGPFWYLLHRSLFSEVVFKFADHKVNYTREERTNLRIVYWQAAHVLRRQLRRRIHCNRLVFKPNRFFSKTYQRNIRRFFRFYPIPLSQ